MNREIFPRKCYQGSGGSRPLDNVFQSVRTFPITQAVVIGAVSLPVIAAGIFVVLRIRRKPKDKEKLRRMEVNTSGRLGDATITDITEDAIIYEYSVGGLTYTASQDISQLRELIPADSHRLIGWRHRSSILRRIQPIRFYCARSGPVCAPGRPISHRGCCRRNFSFDASVQVCVAMQMGSRKTAAVINVTPAVEHLANQG